MQQDYPTDCDRDRETFFSTIKAGDIFFLILLLFFLSMSMETVIRQSGLCAIYYGQETFQQMIQEAKGDGPSLSRTKLTLWSTGIAYPVLALLFPLIFKLRTGLPISLMGIHRQNLGKTLRLALGGFLTLLPATYLLQAIVVLTLKQTGISNITDHPLAELTGETLTLTEKFLMLTSAVIGGAILEEELFRGILLPWFLSRPNGAALSAGAALVVTLMFQSTSLWKAACLLWQNNMVLVNAQDKAVLSQALLPIVFCLIMGKLIHLAAQSDVWRDYATIVAVGLLFGMIHTFAWPSPVSLTLLGSGLGLVFYKSGNLLGPIAIHSTFNGFAFLLIIFPHLIRQLAGGSLSP